MQRGIGTGVELLEVEMLRVEALDMEGLAGLILDMEVLDVLEMEVVDVLEVLEGWCWGGDTAGGNAGYRGAGVELLKMEVLSVDALEPVDALVIGGGCD